MMSWEIGKQLCKVYIMIIIELHVHMWHIVDQINQCGGPRWSPVPNI